MKKLTELEMGMDAELDYTMDTDTICSKDAELARIIAQRHLKDDDKHYSKLKASCGDEISTISVPRIAVIQVSTEPVGQTSLKSSGLGNGGTPTPLKTSNIETPAEKAKVGAHSSYYSIHNKVAMSKTPTISGNTDPLDHYCGMIVKETGQYQYKDNKFANMAGVDNPNGDYGDDDDDDAPFKPNYGGAKKIKPRGDERGGPDDPDIDTPHMGR